MQYVMLMQILKVVDFSSCLVHIPSVFDISKTEGMWTKQDEKLQIKVLELSGIKQKLLNFFKDNADIEHIRVMMDSNTAAAHISNIGGIKSDLRDDIPFEIWQLVSERQI